MKIRCKNSLVVFLGIIALSLGVFACTKKNNSDSAKTEESAKVASKEGESTPLGTNNTDEKIVELKIEDLKVGDGIAAESGKVVEVHYTGWLLDGKKFDSSLDRGEAFRFHLGAGEVIKGWDQGVLGMKVGGKRKLTIPANLAYGERGAGGVIPPNAPLVFEVQLLAVHNEPKD